MDNCPPYRDKVVPTAEGGNPKERRNDRPNANTKTNERESHEIVNYLQHQFTDAGLRLPGQDGRIESA